MKLTVVYFSAYLAAGVNIGLGSDQGGGLVRSSAVWVGSP